MRLARLCQIIIIIKLSFHEIQHNEDKLTKTVAQNKCELKKKLFPKSISWRGVSQIFKFRYFEKFLTDSEIKASFKMIISWAFIWDPVRRSIKKLVMAHFVWPKIFIVLKSLKSFLEIYFLQKKFLIKCFRKGHLRKWVRKS